jgi:tRNA dimethylallyltransferase
VIAIVGPTASGKTEWGLALAKERGGEIVSVDSRQVYRYLTIGTAKPRGQWSPASPRTYLVDGIPYHLVDFLNPDAVFSAADFARRAEDLIKGIRTRKRMPILVGGTGFYFRALLEGLAPLPPADDALREELRTVADHHGREYLHHQLAQVDPLSATKIPFNNIHRVVRALEVYRLTGKPISQWHLEHPVKSNPDEPLEVIGLDPGKEELEKRLQQRCGWMLANGMIEETQSILQKGFSDNCAGLSGLGYPHIVAFLKGTISRDETLQRLIQDTRRYVKRQRTWFGHQMKVQWKKS